ncbi:NTP transferase domain-containing protein [Helicobacter sp. MIT 99-5507]|uniref:NTP transferase domain-containing protein n=1 Tax=Helicobacter sp. MIT 99-5507 TaxID=152489 RepID=UPI000E1E66BC|nr:NTP transferase domain-containing protein [Helicobacter sp. MIT 99-5507]RDU57604.1 hypothetical protein CQA42_06715 [Helicobacter sp. MIT 99-5507]
MIKKTCVVLCGGKSSRMGSNKSILPFGTNRLITYQITKLSQIFSNVAISLKENKKDEILRILYDDISKNNIKINTQSIQIITEDLEYFSPLFGILNCFNTLDINEIFFIPIDYPFIRIHTINTLINNSNTHDVIYAKDSNKMHPLIGIWKRDIKDKIAQSLRNNEFKILDFLSSCNTKSIYFSTDEFMNLNTKQDYENAIKILRE